MDLFQSLIFPGIPVDIPPLHSLSSWTLFAFISFFAYNYTSLARRQQTINGKPIPNGLRGLPILGTAFHPLLSPKSTARSTPSGLELSREFIYVPFPLSWALAAFAGWFEVSTQG
jgi:hypothetical protein